VGLRCGMTVRIRLEMAAISDTGRDAVLQCKQSPSCFGGLWKYFRQEWKSQFNLEPEEFMLSGLGAFHCWIIEEFGR